MSSDLVKRLREPYYARTVGVETTCNEAADRIEALEGEVHLATITIKGWINGYEKAVAKVDALEGERVAAEARAERLRVALQDVVDAYDFVIVDEYDRGWSSVSDAVEAARKAIRAAAGGEGK